MSHSDSYSRLWMTVGRSVWAKSAKMTWRSEWTPRLEKLFENALWASSSRNRRKRGAKSEYEEASERRGFRVEVDLRLGAIDTTNVNKKRGREKETIRKVPKQFIIVEYVKRNTYAWRMHEHVTCKRNCIVGLAQSKPISTQIVCTHLNAWKYCYNAYVMQCMKY